MKNLPLLIMSLPLILAMLLCIKSSYKEEAHNSSMLCVDNKVYYKQGDTLIEDTRHLSCLPISKD
jgi:hypothetical protein